EHREAEGVGVEAPLVVAVRIEPRRDAEHALVDVALQRRDRAGHAVGHDAGEGGDRGEHQWRTLAKMSSREKSGVKPVARSNAPPSTVQAYLRKSSAPDGVGKSPSRKRRAESARANGTGEGT